MSHTQWERRRAEMEASPQLFDKRVYDELGDGVKMVKTASELTLILLRKMMVATMKSKFKVLTDHGHKVPQPHQTVCTKQHAVELSESADDQNWSEVCVPMLANESDIKAWTLEEMYWWAITGVFTGDAIFLWIDSVFTNSIWNLLDQIGEQGPRRRLASLCEMFGEQHGHISEDTHTNYKCLLNVS